MSVCSPAQGPTLVLAQCRAPALPGGVLGFCPPSHSFTQGPLRPGHSSQFVSLAGKGQLRPHRSGRPGCPRRRPWKLPSTSGGHDPISAARGRDRCFLPVQAQDWGVVCKSWGGGRPRRRGDPEEGEYPPIQQEGQLPAPEKSQAPLNPLTGSPVGLSRHAEEGVGAVSWRQRTGHADSGLSWSRREVGRVQAANAVRSLVSTPTPPVPAARPLCPCLARLQGFPNPAPPVPLGLPPNRSR